MKNRIIGAFAVLALGLLPIAACGDAQTTTDAPPETQRNETETDTQKEHEPQKDTNTQPEPVPQAEQPVTDPQAIVDALQVGSDGSTDTMDDVPQTNMYDTWMSCMPQGLVDGVQWIIGPQSEYIRIAAPGELPLMFACTADATGMPDDIRQSVTASQDGQWHMADWDGYQALWQRSATQSDVIIRMQ